MNDESPTYPVDYEGCPPHDWMPWEYKGMKEQSHRSRRCNHCKGLELEMI